MIATGLVLIALFFARVVFASTATEVDWYIGRVSNTDVVIALGGLTGAVLVLAGLVKLAWTYLP